MSAVIVFSADEKFIPLAKGMVLSLESHRLRESGFELAFLNIGCGEESLDWLRRHGVAIVDPDFSLMGDLAQVATGYHISQASRPFLPRFFPRADCLIWLDSDVWVQLPDTVRLLASYASHHRDKLFICPEWHYSYALMNSDIVKFHVENAGFYYRAAYGPEIAAQLAVRPMLNTGVFAMAADNPLWRMWEDEVQTLYKRDYGDQTPLMQHMAEQLALNHLALRTGNAVSVDPLFNFLCTWTLPYRDDAGVVRVPLPPHAAVGIVHLSFWRERRNYYLRDGLLFDQGRYLSDAERAALMW